MNGNKLTVCLLALAAASGCGAADKGHVDPRVAAQVVVSRLDPPQSCSYLSTVQGKAAFGELSDAHGDLIRQAVLGGGNFVSIDMVERQAIATVGGYTIHGRLYSCQGNGPTLIQAAAPKPPAPSESRVMSDTAGDAIALPKASCEPACSAGFTCVKAECVKAPAGR
jgi:hypothetical protein